MSGTSDTNLVAPATVTIATTDASGTHTSTIHIAAPPVVIPPEPTPIPPATVQVVKAGDPTIINTSDHHALGIDVSGNALWDTIAIPGGNGSSAVGYDPATNNVYGQDAAAAAAGSNTSWWLWNKQMGAGSAWSQPSPPWNPIAPAPPIPPTPTDDLRSRMIAWLTGMPARKKILVGQYIDSATAGTGDADAFTSATGKHPAILGDGYWPAWPNTYSANIAPVNAAALAAWKAGALPYLNSFYPCPKGPQDMYQACDPSEVLRVGSAQYNQLHAYYDQEIVGFLALQNAGVKAFLSRAFLECKWNFWWGFSGGSGWSDAQFKALFRERIAYYKSKGVTAMINVYSQGFNKGDGSGHDTYPGDDVVDVQGEDVYSNVATQYKPLYTNELAQHPTKPWCMAEWGSGSPSAGDPSFNMNTLLADIQGQMPQTILFQGWCGSWRLANMQGLVSFVNNSAVLTRENAGRPS